MGVRLAVLLSPKVRDWRWVIVEGGNGLYEKRRGGIQRARAGHDLTSSLLCLCVTMKVWFCFTHGNNGGKSDQK